jgi:hypothetical protein
MKLFNDLSPEQEEDFRQWAQENYEAFSSINGCWHPVIQDECRLINEKASLETTNLF